MRLAAICIKYYTADHPPLNISCIVIYKKTQQMRRLFPNAGADEKPGVFLLGLTERDSIVV
jgi:hypothetical protein